MSKKFWNTDRFKWLQREWEIKLKESGFKDIEDENGRLKQNAANSYRTSIHAVIDGKQRYFELLGQWHHERDFKNDIERLVMQRRSEGVLIKDILMELESIGKKRHWDTVRLIIRFYERKWGIKR